MQKITPFLWFDNQAEEAAKFYTSLFDDAGVGTITHYGKEGYDIHDQPEGQVMTAEFELAGFRLIALNGGPLFKFTPSISFFVICETEKETDKLWGNLTEDGATLMPLDKYEWSEKYGWAQDRFGLTWQVSLGKIADVGQKITPSFLFVNEQMGRAEEAIQLYTTVFNPSDIDGILKYGPGEDGPEGTVKHVQFSLLGGKFMVMDGPGKHDFSFNEAISLVVGCETQKEVDYFWEKLTADGGEESMCGWLKDKFGVSWQVEPTILHKMLMDPDPEKTARVTRAFLRMKKFDIQKLQEAYDGND